jgi:hypothetical protein
MIPLWLTEWIAPRMFKLVGSGLVAVIGVSACMVRDSRLKEAGKTEVVQASKAAGAEANAKSEKVRRAAREPGAADRLRKDRATCPDC